jgi:hypothetical protein
MKLLGSRKSYAMEIATKPLVMASEISGLEPLHAFIKQENHVVPVHFQFAKKHGGQPEFIERKLPEIAPRPSPPTPVARTEQTPRSMLPRSVSTRRLPFRPWIVLIRCCPYRRAEPSAMDSNTTATERSRCMPR